LKISLDGANALWLPAERARGMQISVVIELMKGSSATLRRLQ
jgi:hypothetical protein